MKKFKAWPLLVILALVYWAKEYLGVNNVDDIESLSKALLPIVVMVAVIVAIILSSFRGRKKKE